MKRAVVHFFFGVSKEKRTTTAQKKVAMSSVSLPSSLHSSATNGQDDVENQMKKYTGMLRWYLPVFSPESGKPMLHIKKHGDCTMIDPRACFAHYECAADVACILYAHVSLEFFHCMVLNGYISNKQRVVLRDVEHDTYVFVLVENIQKDGNRSAEDVATILQHVQRPQGRCRPGVDILNATLPGSSGGRKQIGYMFSQPVVRRVHTHTHTEKRTQRLSTLFRRGGNARADKMRHSTVGVFFARGKKKTPPPTRVLSAKDWRNRVENEKAQHDCKRQLFNSQKKQDMMMCRGNPSANNDSKYRFYVPTLVIEAKYGITKQKLDSTMA